MSRERLGMGTALDVAAATVLTSTPVFLPGAMNEFIRQDTGLRADQFGLVLALYWIGSLAGAFASRRARITMAAESRITAAMSATAVGLAAGAFLPDVGLWFGSTLGGFAYGYSQPYTNLLLMRRCAERVRGSAFGLKQAAVPAATLLCSLAVPLLAVPFGWRAVFAIAAGLCVAHVVVSLLAHRGTNRIRTDTTTRPLPWNAHLLALACAGALGALVGNSLGGFLITALAADGLSITTASWVVAVGACANIAVRLGAGVAVDRRPGSAPRLLHVMFLAGAVGTLLLAVAPTAAQLIGAVLAYAGGWGWAGLLHYVTGVAYPGRENRATAASQMGVSLGAALGPALFGAVFTHVGLGAAWAVVTVAGVLATLSVAVAYRLQPPTEAPTAAMRTDVLA